MHYKFFCANVLLALRSLSLFIATTTLSLVCLAQNAPPPNRPRLEPPKKGVCPLPILPALPTYADTSFFALANVPHGKIEQVHYKNYVGADKRMHVYLPPDYDKNSSARYPVLYLNHGGGDDDSKWSSTDPKKGGNAGNILDNLIAAGKGKRAGDEINFVRKVGDFGSEEFVAKRVK